MNSFYQTIQAAISDIEEHGYDSAARIDGWLQRIEQAAKDSSTPPHVAFEAMNRTMHGIYSRMVDGGGYTQVHKGISRFTVDRLKPKLRAELDRRLMANANLIKLNRDQMIDQTRRRFMGWATSVPAGGSRSVDKMGVKADLKKAFSTLPYEERRVLIDQGHKLASELNNIIAVDGGAIAGEWHSHWRQPGYNYDPAHKRLDGKIFVVRANWAIEKGLMTKGDGYIDDNERPAERPFCRCQYRYIYNLRDLPDALLTEKGRKALSSAQT
jgi:hypothetical protein